MAIALATASFAQPTLVTDRAALGDIDFVDWRAFGPDDSTVPSGATINTFLGMTVTVTNPSGNFLRLDQSSGWGGNFAPGDPLMFTNSTVGPMGIAFDVPGDSTSNGDNAAIFVGVEDPPRRSHASSTASTGLPRISRSISSTSEREGFQR